MVPGRRAAGVTASPEPAGSRGSAGVGGVTPVRGALAAGGKRFVATGDGAGPVRVVVGSGAGEGSTTSGGRRGSGKWGRAACRAGGATGSAVAAGGLTGGRSGSV